MDKEFVQTKITEFLKKLEKVFTKVLKDSKQKDPPHL